MIACRVKAEPDKKRSADQVGIGDVPPETTVVTAVPVVAHNEVMIIRRITSYNVCYTKLLRNTMAFRLGRQFNVLSTMAEIDRLILSALDAKNIIKTVLLRMLV